MTSAAADAADPDHLVAAIFDRTPSKIAFALSSSERSEVASDFDDVQKASLVIRWSASATIARYAAASSTDAPGDGMTDAIGPAVGIGVIAGVGVEVGVATIGPVAEDAAHPPSTVARITAAIARFISILLLATHRWLEGAPPKVSPIAVRSPSGFAR
jgi:hypothetical protein